MTTDKKQLWIFHHYATTPSMTGYTRPYDFGINLLSNNIETKVFSSSHLHFSNEELLVNNELFVENNDTKIPHIFIRTRKYSGNGKDRILNMISFYQNLFKVVREYLKSNRKPDYILASSPHPLTLLAGIKIAKKINVPCICEVRDLWPETMVQMGKINRKGIVARILYALEKYIYKNANSLIFTMPGGKDYLRDIGLDTNKFNYINNGLDLEEFNYNKTINIYKDRDLDNESNFNIVYTGSMGQANELMYVLKAAELLNGYKDIKFILFGDGYQKEELENYVEENNLNNIIFKGRVEQKYIPSILNRSDLNIFTGQNINLYKYGISLNKLFKYFGSGKPTISNISTDYDLISKYKAGKSVAPGDPSSLAEGILEFYNMPLEEYNTFCKNALLASKEFDYKVLSKKLEKIIGEL